MTTKKYKQLWEWYLVKKMANVDDDSNNISAQDRNLLHKHKMQETPQEVSKCSC